LCRARQSRPLHGRGRDPQASCRSITGANWLGRSGGLDEDAGEEGQRHPAALGFFPPAGRPGKGNCAGVVRLGRQRIKAAPFSGALTVTQPLTSQPTGSAQRRPGRWRDRARPGCPTPGAQPLREVDLRLQAGGTEAPCRPVDRSAVHMRAVVLAIAHRCCTRRLATTRSTQPTRESGVREPSRGRCRIVTQTP
jgi:hypothetical protein